MFSLLYTSPCDDKSTHYLCLKGKEGGTGNNPSYTKRFQDTSGTIALPEDLSVASVPKKAVFNITFEIDLDGNKIFNHEPLYTNAGELVLKGEFIVDPESENNIRLQLSLQFPEVYSEALRMQENRSLNHTTTTPESKYFS